jgi:hypothetical protein
MFNITFYLQYFILIYALKKLITLINTKKQLIHHFIAVPKISTFASFGFVFKREIEYHVVSDFRLTFLITT